MELVLPIYPGTMHTLIFPSPMSGKVRITHSNTQHLSFVCNFHPIFNIWDILTEFLAVSLMDWGTCVYFRLSRAKAPCPTARLVPPSCPPAASQQSRRPLQSFPTCTNSTLKSPSLRFCCHLTTSTGDIIPQIYSPCAPPASFFGEWLWRSLSIYSPMAIYKHAGCIAGRPAIHMRKREKRGENSVKFYCS